MADTMRISGLTSGFDTESMIKQLMSSYQTKIDKQNQKLQKLSWQQSAYQDVTKKITEFKNKYFDVLKRDTYLMSSSTFNKFTSSVTATNGADTTGLTVSTTSNSAAGSYKVKLAQLATSSRAEGGNVDVANFRLDLDKAVSAGGKDVTNADGSKTRQFELALDVKVGSVSKTINFDVSAALDADGNIADKDALYQDLTDALNTKLQEGFGYSGRPEAMRRVPQTLTGTSGSFRRNLALTGRSASGWAETPPSRLLRTRATSEWRRVLQGSRFPPAALSLAPTPLRWT